MNPRNLLLILLSLILVNACKKEDNQKNNSGNGNNNQSVCIGGMNTVTDIDGNIYNIIQIGNQCWTKENLRTTKYRNGDNISTGLNDSMWQFTTSGAYSYYEDSLSFDNIYGKLYNYYAVVDSRGLCPTGWHVPTQSEWHELIIFLDSQADTSSNFTQSFISGGLMKSTGTAFWWPPNTNASDSSGFSGLPGGSRITNGNYLEIRIGGHFWSSSLYNANSGWDYYLNYYDGYLNRKFSSKVSGHSVRCIKD